MILRDYINSIFYFTFNFSLILHKTYSIYIESNTTTAKDYLYKTYHKRLISHLKYKTIPIL